MAKARSKIQTVNGNSVDANSTKDDDRMVRVLKVDAMPGNHLQVKGTAPSGKVSVACTLTTSYTNSLLTSGRVYKTQTEVALSNDDTTWTIVFAATEGDVYSLTAHGDAPGTNDYLEVAVNPTITKHPDLIHRRPLLVMNPIQAATPPNVTVTGTVLYANNPVTCQATPIDTTDGTSKLRPAGTGTGSGTATASSIATVTFNGAGTTWTAKNFNPQLTSGTTYIVEASAANEGTVSQEFTPT